MLRWDRMGRGAHSAPPLLSAGDPVGLVSCHIPLWRCANQDLYLPLTSEDSEARGPCVPSAARAWERGSAHSQPCCPRALSRDVQRAGSAGPVLLTQHICPSVPALCCLCCLTTPSLSPFCPPTPHSLCVGLLVPTLPPGDAGTPGGPPGVGAVHLTRPQESPAGWEGCPLW